MELFVSIYARESVVSVCLCRFYNAYRGKRKIFHRRIGKQRNEKRSENCPPTVTLAYFKF